MTICKTTGRNCNCSFTFRWAISTARNADQIVVLVNGRVAELGTHDELLERNGYYTALAEKQQLEEELAVTT